jgi:argininosuccinate lyase
MSKKGGKGFAEVSQARLGREQSKEMLEYVWIPYADLDEENLTPMIKCNMAHTVMLAEEGIVPREDAAAILQSLIKLETHLSELNFDPKKGDLFFNVEAYVIEQTNPEIGGKMHLGRSRIDLIAALMRLKVRTNLLRLLSALVEQRHLVLEKAEAYADVIMPAYTHLQPAQVSTFGHYLLAFYDVLGRDLGRLSAAFRSTNRCPLGAAASAGTSWPLNRERITELLGFSELIENAKDAAHNYDWLPEVLSAVGILMNNLSRLASDLYIWCSNEFNLIELDGAFAASSSIMPQKKNPYSLEMIKAQTGEVSASFGAVLEVLKGDTGGTGFDIKLVGPKIAHNAIEKTANMVLLLTPLLRTLRLNVERMHAMAGEGFTTAVGLADAIVAKGLSFRTAHLVTGCLVRMALDRGIAYHQVNASLVDEAARDVIGQPVGLDNETVRRALDVSQFVLSRDSVGGPAPGEMGRMVQARTAERKKEVEELHLLNNKIELANDELQQAVHNIMGKG